MLNLPPAVRIFLCVEPADMRRSFDGLSTMAEHIVRVSPFSGHLFVFRNKRADRVKILYWDRSGFAIWYKRLEKGCFQFPCSDSKDCLEVEAMELAMLLEGIDLRDTRQRTRFVRPAAI
jgi:transposase